MRALLFSAVNGSSPRAWGTPCRKSSAGGNHRFIPTGVGNSRATHADPQRRPVHPHGRGELCLNRPLFPLSYGSSPRAWGTPDLLLTVSFSPRFIPTGVGNSDYIGGVAAASTVHPHGRGELADWAERVRIHFGSSPRAWGTRLPDLPGIRIRRFIPTGVGNSFKGNRIPSGHTVHPHGRGELSGILSSSKLMAGSSPRAWGTPSGLSAGSPTMRFIPTGVGNSYLKSCMSRQSAVHPHGRGELKPAPR